MFAKIKAKFNKTEQLINNREEINKGWKELTMTQEEELQQLVDAKPEDKPNTDARPGMAKRTVCGAAAVATAPVVVGAYTTECALGAAAGMFYVAGNACMGTADMVEKGRLSAVDFMADMWSTFKQSSDEAAAETEAKLSK